MKRTLIPLAMFGLLSLPLFAAEVDPRVVAIMRKEQSAAQSFCFSFMQDPGTRGAGVAQKCLAFFSARYFANYGIAGERKDAIVTGESVFRAHGEFCASIGDYTKPGDGVKSDCQAWNRLRGELLVLGAKDGTPFATLSEKIDQIASARRRFCQSVLRAGHSGDASVFSSRVNQCFASAAGAKAVDAAIFLGAF